MSFIWHLKEVVISKKMKSFKFSTKAFKGKHDNKWWFQLIWFDPPAFLRLQLCIKVSLSLVASPEIQKKKWTECQKYITHFCECFLTPTLGRWKLAKKIWVRHKRAPEGSVGALQLWLWKKTLRCDGRTVSHAKMCQNQPQNISKFWLCVTHILPAHAGESEPFTNTAYFSVHSLCCTFRCSPTLVKRWKWSRRRSVM